MNEKIIELEAKAIGPLTPDELKKITTFGEKFMRMFNHNIRVIWRPGATSMTFYLSSKFDQNLESGRRYTYDDVLSTKEEDLDNRIMMDAVMLVGEYACALFLKGHEE